HEARGVHLEQSHEGTTTGLVAVRLLTFAAVHLRKNFECQGWKGKPGRLHRRLVSDGERKSPDGQKVRRGAEPQIDIEAPRHRGTLHAVQTPSPVRADGHAQVDLTISGDAGDARRRGPPARITQHGIVESARAMLVREHRGPRQLPCVTPANEPSQLMTGNVEPAPENR